MKNNDYEYGHGKLTIGKSVENSKGETRLEQLEKQLEEVSDSVYQSEGTNKMLSKLATASLKSQFDGMLVGVDGIIGLGYEVNRRNTARVLGVVEDIHFNYATNMIEVRLVNPVTSNRKSQLTLEASSLVEVSRLQDIRYVTSDQYNAVAEKVIELLIKSVGEIAKGKY